jgi:tripartite-type tricarboxylate transporter receptor subunit TctC
MFEGGKSMNRTRVAVLVAGLAVLATFAVKSSAQSPAGEPYPSRVIRFIVPFPPGGGADVVSRLIAAPLAEALGKSVIVDNKPGAQGNIGAGMAARAPADGYTILFGYSGTHAVNPTLYPEVPFKEADFQPVIWMMSVPQVMTLHPSVQARTVPEFIALAKSQPDKMNFASSGAINQLAGELFNTMAGTKITHIPYKGGAAATTGLLSGDVGLSFLDPASALPFVKSGKLRAIAVTSAKRSSTFPDLPTVAEAALPGYEVTSWNGILVPAGTPPEIVKRLNTEINRILASPEMRTKLADLGYEPVGGTPEQFAAQITKENAKWGKIVKSANMKAD